MPAAQVEVTSDSKILLTTPKQVPGLSDVAVINPDGQVAVVAKGFLFKPPPKIQKVEPAAGSTLGNQAITIEGVGFQSGVQVKIGGTSVNQVKSVDSGKIVVLSPKGKPGAAAVTVINPDGGSHTLGGGFTYISPPKINNVFPGLGPEQGGTNVTIQGEGFVTGVKGSKVYFGSKQVPGKDLKIDSTGIITCKSPAGTGPVAVKVVNPDGQLAVKAGAFVYIPKIPAPQPTHLAPAFGMTSGGYLVSVYGKGFLNGAALRFGNKGTGYKYATGLKVHNAGTLIVATVPAHAPGKFDVVVTNSDGQSGTIAGGFEFIAPLGLPGLAFGGIAPNRGPQAGGYVVTVYGQGFKSGVKVYFGKSATATWTEAARSISRCVMGAPAARGGPPKSSSNSDEVIVSEEGCLSLPEYYAEVRRPAAIQARYLDRQGKVRELAADGLLATCIQHEMDHLDGVLFVDHLSALKRNIILRKLSKMKRAAGEAAD